jgi:hypothetical protein
MSTDFPGVNTPPAQDEAVDLGTLSPAFTGAMSMTLWWFLNQRGPDPTIIFGKGDALADSAKEWSLGYEGTGPTDFEFILNTGAGGVVLQASTNLAQLGIWRLLACTYDGANKRIYLDGVLDATAAETGNIVSSSKATNIGGVLVAGSIESEINARLGDVRLYDRALSAAEIETMYTLRGLDGIVDGLLHRWELREWVPGGTAGGSGGAKDSGPGQFNGTPINSPLGAESGLRLR